MGVCNECILNVNGNPSIKSCSTKVINDDKIFRQNYQAPIPKINDEIQLVKELKETEILLIGSGPSGMGVLNSIKNSSEKIIIIDEKDSIGGQYYKKISNIFDLSKQDVFDQQQKEGLNLEQKLKSKNFEYIFGTKVWGIFQKEDDFYEVCCSKNNQDIRIITKKIIVAEIINGLKNLLKEIPELRIAVISEFDDNLEVNHITDKKTNIGNKKYP